MSFVAGTMPYPWPFDGDLDPAGLALLVVGAQRWWQDRTHGSDRVMDRLARVADTIRSVGGVVVVVRHGAVRGLGAGAGPARLPARVGPGWDLVWAPGPNDQVIDAGGVDGFFASGLDAELRGLGRTRLVVGGLGLESTVYSSTAAANDRGYECLVLSDASAPHEPSLGPRALSSITMSGGIFAAVGTSGSLCDGLAGVAEECA